MSHHGFPAHIDRRGVGHYPPLRRRAHLFRAHGLWFAVLADERGQKVLSCFAACAMSPAAAYDALRVALLSCHKSAAALPPRASPAQCGTAGAAEGGG